MRRKIFLTQDAHIITHNSKQKLLLANVKKLEKAAAS